MCLLPNFNDPLSRAHVSISYALAMKLIVNILVVGLSLSSVGLRAQKTATTLPIDPTATSLTWTGHAEVGTYAPSGTLAVTGGQVTFLNGRFTGALMTIDMKSLNQSNADLTHHLKGSDFFDVDRFPIATLKLEQFDKIKGMVTGTLTLKDKTSAFRSPVTLSGNGGQFIVTGKVTLDRTIYGIVYNSTNFFSGLGDKAIRNTFDVEFKVVGTGTLPPL